MFTTPPSKDRAPETKMYTHSLKSHKMGPSIAIMVKEKTWRLMYFIISFIYSRESGKNNQCASSYHGGYPWSMGCTSIYCSIRSLSKFTDI